MCSAVAAAVESPQVNVGNEESESNAPTEAMLWVNGSLVSGGRWLGCKTEWSYLRMTSLVNPESPFGKETRSNKKEVKITDLVIRELKQLLIIYISNSFA